MDFEIRATTTDRDPETFRVSAVGVNEAEVAAEAHLVAGCGWKLADLERGTLYVKRAR